jgi:hypothetical protein
MEQIRPLFFKDWIYTLPAEKIPLSCEQNGRLCHPPPNAVANAVGYGKFFSRSHPAVIRVSDAAGNVIETHEHKGASSKSGSNSAALLIKSHLKVFVSNLPNR